MVDFWWISGDFLLVFLGGGFRGGFLVDFWMCFSNNPIAKKHIQKSIRNPLRNPPPKNTTKIHYPKIHHKSTRNLPQTHCPEIHQKSTRNPPPRNPPEILKKSTAQKSTRNPPPRNPPEIRYKSTSQKSPEINQKSTSRKFTPNLPHRNPPKIHHLEIHHKCTTQKSIENSPTQIAKKPMTKNAPARCRGIISGCLPEKHNQQKKNLKKSTRKMIRVGTPDSCHRVGYSWSCSL